MPRGGVSCQSLSPFRLLPEKRISLQRGKEGKGTQRRTRMQGPAPLSVPRAWGEGGERLCAPVLGGLSLASANWRRKKGEGESLLYRREREKGKRLLLSLFEKKGKTALSSNFCGSQGGGKRPSEEGGPYFVRPTSRKRGGTPAAFP